MNKKITTTKINKLKFQIRLLSFQNTVTQKSLSKLMYFSKFHFLKERSCVKMQDEKMRDLNLDQCSVPECVCEFK